MAKPGPGHNNPPTDEQSDVQRVAAAQLRAFVERVERLEEDKKAIASDIKDVFAEAKGSGYDTKALRTIIRARKKEASEREEEVAILQLYAEVLGMGSVGIFG